MRDKRMTLEQAASLVEDGMTLGIGGSTLRRHPMALIRELIRQGRKDLTLQAWLGGIDFDLLVGAGCVRKIETAYVGLGPLGGGPNVRRAARAGHLEIEFYTESSMIARFKAAAEGLPFYPTRVLLGTDFAEHAPVKTVIDPFSGQELHAVRPARPDLSIIHGYYGDDAGNVQHPARRNRDDIDVLLANASARVVVTVEQLIPRSRVQQRPQSTYLPHHWVHAIVETPIGAHPGNCDAFYRPDFVALETYLEAAKTPETFQAWLRRHVLETDTELDYLDRATTVQRIASLSYPNEV